MFCVTLFEKREKNNYGDPVMTAKVMTMMMRTIAMEMRAKMKMRKQTPRMNHQMKGTLSHIAFYCNWL